MGRVSADRPINADVGAPEELAYFTEPAEAYVRRRHGELRAAGLTNDRIFHRIAVELPLRRVTPPELSLRQLRRIVYG